MRTAPPVRSPLACIICLKFLDDSVIARAYLFCHLPTLPLVCFSAPIPPPALAERSSLREGGDYKLILPGASPLASRGSGRGAALARRALAIPGEGLASWSPARPATATTRRGGANKAGTLKIHRAADRRQATGRSSRAEYSEVPGIVGPLSGSDGSFFVILPDRRSSFCGEKRPPGRPGQAPQSHRRWCCRIRTCYPFRR